LNTTSSSLSLTGALVGLIMFAFVQKSRTYYSKVVISLITTDLFYAITNLLGETDVGNTNQALCFATAFVKFYATISGTFFILVITKTCYL